VAIQIADGPRVAAGPSSFSSAEVDHPVPAQPYGLVVGNPIRSRFWTNNRHILIVRLVDGPTNWISALHHSWPPGAVSVLPLAALSSRAGHIDYAV
jgi:hypothetical protein